MSESATQGDIKVHQNENGEIDIRNVPDNPITPVLDDGLENYYYISLLSNKLADITEELASNTSSREGWWGDEFNKDFKLGSRLWMRTGMQLSQELLIYLREDIEDAILWMEKTGLVDYHVVTVTIAPGKKDMVIFNIHPFKDDIDQLGYKFYYNWRNQFIKRKL